MPRLMTPARLALLGPDLSEWKRNGQEGFRPNPNLDLVITLGPVLGCECSAEELLHTSYQPEIMQALVTHILHCLSGVLVCGVSFDVLCVLCLCHAGPSVEPCGENEEDQFPKAVGRRKLLWRRSKPWSAEHHGR